MLSRVTADSQASLSRQVYCDQTTAGGGWTVFQKRLDGSVNFFRGWGDYKHGFGDVRGEFWLGLDKTNRLTRHGTHTLRVDLQDKSGETRFAEYENFALLGEQTNYKLIIGKYKGTILSIIFVGLNFSDFPRYLQ